MRSLILSFILLLITDVKLTSQYVAQKSSSEIYEQLEKFNFLGSALYVAAHPDDENTRLISYLSNDLNARTAYLSITRGDGGQNLIGTEIRELLGVLRSQELQMARKVDGGQQFFTRANDFGYSKHPDETLTIWNKDEVLEDMVYVIRKFQPDVIVNRFDHRTPGRTHGHHTSSAMLALEAYKLAQDPKAFSWQLEELDTWKVRRHFFNTSWWFYGSQEKFAEADKSRLLSVEVGNYYPTLGLSNNEISGIARSQHRSQGFGSSGSRESYQEYLELIEGDMPENKEDIFEGIETGWSRIPGADKISGLVDKLMNEFNFRNPAESIDKLLAIHDVLSGLAEGHWRDIKLAELNEIIVQCLGFFAEPSVERQQYTIGDSIEVTMEFTNRSDIPVTIEKVLINGKQEIAYNLTMEDRISDIQYHKVFVDNSFRFSNPVWLDEKASLGMYTISNREERTIPESPPALNYQIELDILSRNILISRPANYRYVDPAEGEIRKPVAIVPPATIQFDKELYLLASEQSCDVKVKLRSSKDQLSGVLKLSVPESWTVVPAEREIRIDLRGIENTYDFKLSAPDRIAEGSIQASVMVDGKSYDKSLINIDYEHIPLQTVLLPAESRIVKVPLETGGNRIAYLMGAGDKLPESLEYVGYDIDLISIDDLKTGNLDSYDAVVIGIRAYNTLEDLKLYNQVLFDYAYKGGTLVTQYNTSRRLDFDHLAPYPIKLSRNRVTDENAEIRILNPNHRVLNYPNKISNSDFDSWVQERGLYFPEEWDKQYEAILSSNDSGESPLDGSLLVAPHGDGYFVYTSLSWFRQLPAGVPGAFRLFANILALSDNIEDRP